MPVAGPARCTSQITSGSSSITASEMVSIFRAMPGPDVLVTPTTPSAAFRIGDEPAVTVTSAWKPPVG